MKNADNIFLIGYMGSGKSTLGRKLADAMHWSFVDLDEQIENQSGQSIPEIFEQKGEQEFRQIESEVLEQVSKNKNQVVATGGGAPLEAINLQYMQQSGLVVYLKVSPEELKKRLPGERSVRPLLRDKSDAQLEVFISDHLKSRIPVYEKADVIFEADKGLSGLLKVLESYSR